MNTKLKKAVETLCKALEEDKSEGSYYYSWQANIAMAFKDEFMNHEFGGRIDISKDDIHQIANNAAKNFLDLLCRNS